MGLRKQNSAELRKEEKKSTFVARLSNSPTSPRKMNLVAELIRGKDVYEALNILHFSNKHAAKKMEKLLRSAIANFEQKSGLRAEDSGLYVGEVRVDGAPILKRFRPAPQGRAYRIRKRSNHIILSVISTTMENELANAEETATGEEVAEETQIEEAQVVNETAAEEVNEETQAEETEVAEETTEEEPKAEDEQKKLFSHQNWI